MLPPDTVEKIIDLYCRQRLSRREVAALAHVSPSVVTHVVRADGRHMRPRGGKNFLRLDHAEFERTAELYRSGLSEQQVADELGIKRGSVHWRLAYAGVPRRGRPEANRLRREGAELAGAAGRSGESHLRAKLTDAQVGLMRAEYAAGGITQRELAARYGVTRTHAHNIVNGKARPPRPIV